MKKIVLGLSMMLCSLVALSQSQGLDGIVVEKYYKANAADHAADSDIPEGAVTYRIYADLKEDWHILSVYADLAKNQRMIFETTATNGFFNEATSGSASHFGADIRYSDLDEGVLMLDSWITLGAAARRLTTPSPNGTNYFGIPKTLDDGLNQIVVTGGAMQNTSGYPPPPVNVQDGYLTVTTKSTIVPGTAGLNSLISMLDGSSTNNSVTLTDAAWFNGDPVANQVMGATSDNMVLLGQFTTEGVFHFALNFVIKKLSDGTVENHVWENPGIGEFLNADLEQTLGMPATPPTVSNLTVTPPSLIVGGDVNLSVEATDNVSISQVEFFRGTTSLGVSPSSSSPYLLTWTSNAVGNFNITAVATDDEGTPATSSIVPLEVLPVPANNPPVVLTLNVDSLLSTMGDPIQITATASDPDAGQTVAQMDFYKNAEVLPFATILGPGPYNTSITPTIEAPIVIKAIATDNLGMPSAPVTITVQVVNPAGAPYRVRSQVVSCLGSDLFYVPVITRPGAPDVANIIGFDLVMKFNSARVRPTGLIRVDRSLIADSTWTSYALRQAGDSLIISLFLNSTAPENTFFAGNGNVLRVEFAKTAAFLPDDNVTFTVSDFIESYNTGILPKLVDAGTFTTFAEDKFQGRLLYWADASPIYYSGDPATSLITNIFGNINPAVMVQPDMNGEFEYDIDNGLLLSIDRNINDAADVMSVINGYDAFLTQKVVLEDPAFRPNVFQIMAMDVNRDGKISAGDVSQILQRATKKIGEFRQAWNYNDDGTKKPGTGASYDWIFADNSHLYGDPRRYGVYAYESANISTSYPKDDGHGFSKFRATVWPANNLSLPVEGTDCPIIYSEDYQGVMYGDIDGNYKNLEFNERPSLKKGSRDGKIGSFSSDSKAANSTVDSETENATSGYTVTFDLSKSSYSDGYLTFPVNVGGPSEINSLDFAMQFEESKLKFNGIVTHLSGMQSDAYYDSADRTLRFSSFSMQKYSTDRPVISVRFEANSNLLTNEDIKSVTAYLNGNKANAEMSEMILGEQTEKVKIYPNPARDFVTIVLTDNADINLLDMLGRTIRTYKDIKAYEKYEIKVADLPQGTYIMRIIMNIGDEEFIATRKLVIKK